MTPKTKTKYKITALSITIKKMISEVKTAQAREIFERMEKYGFNRERVVAGKSLYTWADFKREYLGKENV